MKRITVFVVVAALLTSLWAAFAYSQITVKVGPTFGGDGTTPFVRANRTGAMATVDVGGRYSESVLRGNVYTAAVPPGTGVAPGTALGTTAAFVVWNPSGSGVTIRMLHCSSGYISGTLGGGCIVHCLNTTNSATAPTGGTAVTPTNCFAGSASKSIAKVSFGSTLVATPISAAVHLNLTALVGTTDTGNYTAMEDLQGRYLLQPGNGWSLQGVAGAGTTPLMVFSAVWEEVPQGQE